LDPRETLVDATLLTAKMAIWRWDVESRKVNWHRGLTPLIGRIPDSYDGALELLRPEDRDEFDLMMRRTASEGIETHGTFRLAGKEKTLQVKLFPELQKSKVTSIIGWMCDLTEIHQGQDFLVESAVKMARQEHLLERLQRSAQVGGWEVDFITHEIFWTPEVFVLHGLQRTDQPPSLDEIIELYTTESVTEIKQGVAKCIAGETLDIEAHLKNGTVLRITGDLVRAEGGRPNSLAGAVQDISTQHQAEMSLVQTQRRLNHTLEAVGTGIWDWDLKTNQLLCSSGFASLLGYAQDELLGDAFFFEQVMHPDDKQKMQESLLAHWSGESELFAVEYRWKHKSGDWRWTLGRGRVVERNDDGTPIRMVGSNIDITPRKSLEKQLLTSMKLEGLGRLAGGIAHDFNNLLMAILGHVELLATRDDFPTSAREDIDAIAEAAQTAAHLTRELLAFARQRNSRPRIADLSSLLSSIDSLLRRLLGVGIDLDMRLPDDLWLVEVDPGQFEQTVVNLVLHGREEMPGGGKLSVRAANLTLDSSHSPELKAGPYVCIEIADQGDGEEGKSGDQVFEPFFVRSETDHGGMGLSAAYGHIKQAGGTIEFSGLPGVGTTFRIFLPAHVPTLISDSHAIILVVEDEPLVRDVTIKVLEREEFRVLGAGTASRAREMVAGLSRRVDVLVTDIVLPEMGGIEFARELRATNPSMGVVLVSGYSLEVDGNDLDPIYYVSKPFTPQSLTEAVLKALAPQSSGE